MELDKFNYQTVSEPSIANTVKLQYSYEGNLGTLKPLTGNFANLEIRDVTSASKQDSRLTYDSILSQYSVAKVDSSMQKKAAGINSADDFKTFMTNCFTEQGNNVDGLDMNAVANDGKDYDIYSQDDTTSDTPEKTIKAKYTLHVSNPQGGSEKYMLGEDNNIYWSPEEQTHNSIEPTFNDMYHQKYGNN